MTPDRPLVASVHVESISWRVTSTLSIPASCPSLTSSAISPRRTCAGSSKYLTVVLGAVVKAFAAIRQLRAEAVTALDYGRVPHDALLCTMFPVELILDGIKYVMTVRLTGEHDFAVECNASTVNVSTHELSDGRLLVFADGKTSTVFYEEDSTGLRLEIGNKGTKTVVFENENDPTKLRATTTGKLVRFLVADGQHVDAGQPFCEMEVMKMYMQLVTAHAGALVHAASADSYVKAGDILCQMDLDDKSSVSTAELFTGQLPNFKPPHMPGDRCHHTLRQALERANAVMAGFSDPAPAEAPIATQIMAAINDPSLAVHEIKEAFVAVASALPSPVSEAIENILATEMTQALGSPFLEPTHAAAPPAFPGAADEAARAMDTREQEAQRTTAGVHKMLAVLEGYQGDTRLVGLLAALRRHADGRGVLAWNILQPFMAEYVRVEGQFSGMQSMHEQVVMEMLRQAVDAEIDTPGLTVREQRTEACRKVLYSLVSHERVKEKSKLISDILQTLSDNIDFLHCFPSNVTGLKKSDVAGKGDQKSPQLLGSTLASSSVYLTQQQEVSRLLRAMEDLRGGFYVKVALEARQLAMRIMTPSIDSRKTAIHKMLLEVVEEWSRSNDTEVVKGYRSFGHHLAPLVQSVISLFEEVSSFVDPVYPRELRLVAMELFIRRSFRQYTIASLAIMPQDEEGLICAELWFQRQPRTSRSSDMCILASQGSDDSLQEERRPCSGGLDQEFTRSRPANKKSYGGGNFSDSIIDMQQVVDEWQAQHEPEYPRRYTLYALFYSVEGLAAKFFQVVTTRFRPDECSQEGLNPAQASPSGSRKNSASVMSADGSGGSTASGEAWGAIPPGEPVHALNVLVWMGSREHQPALDKCAELVQMHRLLLRDLQVSPLSRIRGLASFCRLQCRHTSAHFSQCARANAPPD